ncbi:hypothetical protein [Nonomuraea sp. NPDC049129]|uniref:hypothetical protein n=1 Tax=Nonomuraea sp. NPDC049129 TaxID=3155272 RepID=UPI0033D24E5F
MSRSGRDHAGALRQDAATRHLCTGVYLDPELRTVVLRKVHNDPRHMVAPSYGFDLVPVVGHAWLAWRLETAQHLGVLAVFTAGLMIRPASAIVVLSVLAFWWSGRLFLRSALVVLPLRAKEIADHWLRRARWRSEGEELRQHERLLRLCGMGCVVLIVVVFLAASLSDAPLGETAGTAGLLLLSIAVVVGGRGAAHQICLNRMYHAVSLLPARLSPRLRAISEQQSHPYVVYRRPSPPDPEEEQERPAWDLIDEDQSPFVGSGTLVHRWLPPLTIQLLEAMNVVDAMEHRSMEEREYAGPAFQAHELVDHLKKAMAPMGDANDPNALSGFTVNDRVYIAESDVPPHAEWLRELPDRHKMNSIIDAPYGAEHHFLEIGASLTGEIVTTVFVRVTVKGKALSLDFAACALTRTPSEYHVLNAFAESGATAVLRSALRELGVLPDRVAAVRSLAQAPALLIGAVRARKNRLLKPRRGMAIGAQLSIRQEKSTPWRQSQLDEVTIHDHMKLIEQRLLKAVEDFLEDHKIDTSAFKRRAIGIINSGVLNMGGKVEMKQSAVGVNARVRADSREPDKNAEQSSAHEGGE